MKTVGVSYILTSIKKKWKQYKYEIYTISYKISILNYVTIFLILIKKNL